MNNPKNSQKIALVAGIILATIFYLLSQYSNGLVVPSFCLLTGAGMIYAGGNLRSSSLRVKNFGIKTKAKIIDYEIKRSGGENTSKSYYPIVEFTTTDNETISHKLKLNEGSKKLNSIIDIYYLKENNEYKVIKDSK